MRISQAIKSLIHGVSTNDLSHRSPVYLQEQNNMLTTETAGLHKRPPSVIDNLGFLANPPAGRHYIVKDFLINQVKYYLVIDLTIVGGTVSSTKVYNELGTVTAVGGASAALNTYLGGIATNKDIDLLVVEETLYITNRLETTAMATTTPGAGVISSTVVVQSPPDEDQTISITYKPPFTAARTATYTAVGATLTTRGTDVIASQLSIAINVQAIGTDVLSVPIGSTIIIINNAYTTGSQVVVEDDNNGNTCVGYDDETDTPLNLPRFSHIGNTINIQPEDSSDRASYYMESVQDGSSMGVANSVFCYPVRWREATHPNQKNYLDATTMPHTIEKGVGFTAVVPAWQPRRAGNDDTNPPPKFIGDTLNGLSWFQERLVALYGEDITTSATVEKKGDEIEWFRDTTNQLLATHPVSMRSTSDESAEIESAVKHNKDLLLFTKNAQFKLDGTVALTPNTSGIPLVTKYTSNTDVRPLSLGKYVYFATTQGNYTGISRYRAGKEANVQDEAASITAHVKTYLPANPLKLLGDASLGILLVVYSDRIYICDMDIEEVEQRAKRFAWSKWTGFDDTTGYPIVEATLQGSTLQLVQLLDDASLLPTLCSLEILPDPVVTDKIYSLDWQQETTVAATQDLIAVDPDLDSTNFRIIDKDTGARLPFTRLTNYLKLDTPMTVNTDVVYGAEYKSSLVPTNPVIRDESGRVNRYATIGITQWIAQLVHSADITATIVAPHANWVDQYWSGLFTFDINSQSGVVADQSNDFVIGFAESNKLATIELWSEGHLPFNLVNLDYLGKYNQRGKRF